MNTIISIHNVWTEMILNGQKTLEFRHSIPKNIQPGDKVFLYETYKNNGRKMVVGFFTLKSINKLDHKKCRTGYAMFMDYYAQNISKDEEIIKAVQRCSKIILPQFYQEYVYSYMFCDSILDYMETHNDIPELDIAIYMDKTFIAKKAKAETVTCECDDWLRKIGFYNEYDESNYSYVFEIEKPTRLITPMPITEFLDLKGENIKKAPQSWCYTQSN